MDQNYYWPPEWTEQKAVWLAWPNRDDLFDGRIKQVQAEMMSLVLRLSRTVLVSCLVDTRQERLDFLHRLHKEAIQIGKSKLEKIQVYVVPTNDIWMRDYGPLWLAELGFKSNVNRVSDQNQSPTTLLDFRFNAWGEKYFPYTLDDQASQAIANLQNAPIISKDYVLEGGALESSGQTLLAARDCIFHPTRKVDLNQETLTSELIQLTGVNHVVWLEGLLPGDDTDGHLDLYVRFANTDTILLNRCIQGHPASAMLNRNRKCLQEFWYAETNGRQIIDLPMPPEVTHKGVVLPRTYANFLISNQVVFVPVYNVPDDQEALDILNAVFPGRDIEPVYAGDFILEGGAVHCMTMPEFS